MNNRIKKIRQTAGLTQAQFAEKLGLSRNFIAMIEIGGREPSSRTISDICREFSVNELWLRTGVGEPHAPVSREEQVAAVLGSAAGSNKTARNRIIRAIARMPEEMFPAIEEMILAIADELKKEKAE